MPTRRALLADSLRALGACSLVHPVRTLAAPAPAAPRRHLQPYADDAELERALARWRRLQPPQRSARSGQALELQSAPAAAKMADAESITNVQTAGVDEGGIVKHAGDFLVILRRGRLSTVRVGGDRLEPVDQVDAYAPGSDPRGAWYDELLVAGSTVVVVGYSYARGGTEIGLFDLDGGGALRHRATHHLRSFDYYSSRNYASRLVGRTLVFYTPVLLHAWGPPVWDRLPAVRRWQRDDPAEAFRRILPATRIFRTDDDFSPGEPLALHTVTQMDLDSADLQPRCTAVLGPVGRVFYVSQGSVYVWTTSSHGRGVPVAVDEAVGPDGGAPVPQRRSPRPRSRSAVFRLPLDGQAPTALKTAGVPVDQLSFLEAGGHLNVLLREAGPGEGMWGADRSGGAMALLQAPLEAFNDGSAAAQAGHYRRVPAARGWNVQNRFIGPWLVWGGQQLPGRGPGRPGAHAAPAAAWALRFDRDDDAVPLSPGHAVERIEALGSDAVLVGSGGADLWFTSVALGDGDAYLHDRYVQREAAQGETRTHGFFYRAEGAGTGVLGLPLHRRGPRRRHGVHAHGDGAASVLYLRQRDLQFTPLGELRARERGQGDDACKASCVDWYGNARPIFLGRRIFALLGHEIVEGRLQRDEGRGEHIEELRRITFAPLALQRRGERAWPFE